MKTTTDAEVERAFQEWCAMMGLNPLIAGKPGGYRLARDEGEKVHVEELGPSGEAHALSAPMTCAEFVAAVRFLHESMKVKTVMVARAVAQKRKPRV